MKKSVALGAAIVGMIVFGLNILAHLYQWYSTVPFFDKWMHVLGGAFVMLVFVSIATRKHLSLLSVKVLVRLVALVFLVGVLWEGYEYLIQGLTGVDLATIPDSVKDLVADTVGAFVASVVLFFVQRAQRRYNTPNAS